MQPREKLVIRDFARHVHNAAQPESRDAFLDAGAKRTVPDDRQLRPDADQCLEQHVDALVSH